MNFVTDTHSLVWYFTEDSRLSKKAFDAFEGTVKSGTVIVPAVVLVEIMFIAKKGRVTLTFEETLKNVSSTWAVALIVRLSFVLNMVRSLLTYSLSFRVYSCLSGRYSPAASAACSTFVKQQ